MNRNLKRIGKDGKEEMVTNKVRGGIGLVVCEGIAQKAKSVLKHTKNAGLDWSWLNNVIKADKPAAQESDGRRRPAPRSCRTSSRAGRYWRIRE